MKYAFALAGLIAGALAGKTYYPDPKPPEPTTYYAPYPIPTDNYKPPSIMPHPPPVHWGYFGVLSSRSYSPIHLEPVTARMGKFYIGAGPPSSYCPQVVEPNCPPGNTTVFAGGDETLALAVVVPGGQAIYVNKDGSLGYTAPHSGSTPDGALLDRFSLTAPSNGDNFGYLNFETFTSFLACPVGGDNGYQVYAQVDGFKGGSECLGFSALTIEVTLVGAWQY